LRRNLDQAEAEYKVASELSPVRSVPRLRYGDFLFQRGKAGEAIAWVDGITKTAPDYVPAWNARARIALFEKKFDESLAHLQKASQSTARNLDGRLLEGQAFLGKNELKRAVEVLESLDKSFPNLPVVKFELARALVRAGNPNQAGTILDQVISKSPDFAEAILLRAELDLRNGDGDAVVDAMVSLLKKRPELVSAQLLLAQGYSAKGRFAEAAATLQNPVQALPDEPQPLLLLAFVLRQQGKMDEARAAFQKVEKMVPDSLLPLSQLVDMDLLQKDFAGALQKVDARLEKDAKVAGAHFLKGQIYAVQSDWDKAEASLKKAIELNASFISAYDMLAGVYIAANKLPQRSNR
jgi:predicted Zn-dependent protease